jgi:hypothetical protein
MACNVINYYSHPKIVGVLALDTGIKERWVHRKQRRHIEIEMYWEERKMHWESRVTSILGKLEMTKVTIILGWSEYLFNLLVRVLLQCVQST